MELTAAPENFRLPGALGAPRGRYAETIYRDYSFGAPSGSNHSKDQWDMTAQPGLSRMRVVAAWDGTGTGSLISGAGSTSLDGDMDLQVVDLTSGEIVCESDTYDSSWEACDFAVTAGRTYRARMVSYWSGGSPSTYLGVAWFNYSPSAL